MNANHIEDIYPLSPMQQGMLFHSLYAPESGVYVTLSSILLQGQLDISAFTQAWQTVIDRYSILRTAFIWEDLEEPLQVVCRGVTVSLKEHDWRTRSPDEQQARLEVFLQDERVRGFDLSQAPLMRLHLIQLAEDAFQFVWSHHHILLDGWSLPLLIHQIFSAYEALCQGRNLQVSSIRPFRDYIAWLKQQDTSAAENFWRESLKGFVSPTVPRIKRTTPLDVINDAKNEFSEQKISLSEEMTNALQSLAQKHELTLNTILQGALAILLSRYSNDTDVVYGTVVSGRPADLHGVETMVGLFINTLPIRVQVSSNAELIPWLQQLQSHQVQMRHYEYCPLTKVQGWSDIPRDQSLFEVLYAFENYPRDVAATAETTSEQTMKLRISNYRAIEQNNYPLGLLSGSASKLPLKLIYSRRHYDEASMVRMLGHLQMLLEAFVAKPDQALSKLPLLTPTEHQAIFSNLKMPLTDDLLDGSIHGLFEAQVLQTPEAIAVAYEDKTITYDALNKEANQLAHYLQAHGIGPEVRVAINLERGIEMMVAVLGVLKAGGAYVPLDPTYPTGRIAVMLAEAQVAAVLTNGHLALSLPEYQGQIICLDSDQAAISKMSQSNPNSDTASTNLAYVIFTSGSTGNPKGVMVQHQSVLNLSQGLSHTVYEGYGHKPLNISLNGPLVFDTSVKQIIQLLHGHSLYIVPDMVRFDGEALLRYLHAHDIDVFDCTPSQLRLLMHAGLLQRVRQIPNVILLGGEPIDAVMWHALSQAEHIDFYNVYGPTECTVDSTVHPIALAQQQPVIGRPINNVETYILDDHMQPVPIGVPGELYIGGLGVARGYVNHPYLTAERFLPNPWGDAGSRLYRTGDIVRYLSDNMEPSSIEFLGRVDNQVKVHGYRIELGEIDATLKHYPDIQDAVTVLQEDETNDKRLVSYVVPTPSRAATFDGRERYRLPNNLAIVHLNQNETDFLYKEMFEVQAYTRHGIMINDGDVIVDVGANIGLFSLFAHLSRKDVHIYAFEPNPTVFELLEANMGLYDVAAKLFNCGLSSEVKTATFTFYPHYSILSGLYADVADEKDVVRSFMRREHGNGNIDLLDKHSQDQLEHLLTDKFAQVALEVQLTTLSDIIRSQGLTRINLLKINVEKSEYDVLAGISEQDWTKIDQVALEVHDIDGQLDKTISLLEQQGFHLSVEQDWSLDEATHTNYYIYAIQGNVHQPKVDASNEYTVPTPTADKLILTPDAVRTFLQNRLPGYMVPTSFVFLDAIPLTPNGKIDQQALPSADYTRFTAEATFVPPRNPLELQLTQIWESLLNTQPIGLADNFFDLGGHSLLAVRLMGRIKEVFHQDLPLSTLFQASTIGELSKVLSQEIVPLPDTTLVSIQPSGSKPPFFCVHAIGGEVLNFVDLARHLGSDQPFFGLQASNPADAEDAHQSVEEIAARYIEVVREVQPDGPYLLGGLCAGGMIALEMSYQLSQQGHQVPLLALLDSWSPTVLPPYEDDAQLYAEQAQYLARVNGRQLTLTPSELRQFSPDDQLDHVLKQVKQAGLVPPELELSWLRQYVRGYKNRSQAFHSYKPKQYPGRITLFRPSERNREQFSKFEERGLDIHDPTQGWDDFSAEPITTIVTSGYHETMCHEPHVHLLAERLREAIDQALLVKPALEIA